MSDLLATLASAARALDAHRFGLDVVGQNLANVATPGYTRRSVDLVSVPPRESQSAGSGVAVGGLLAARDELLDQRLRRALPDEAREAAVADALGVIATMIGAPGESVDAELSAFFAAFSALADDPVSPTLRQEVLADGASLAAEFRRVSGQLSQAGRDADRGIREAVDQISTLVDRIAQTNFVVGGRGQADPESMPLRDEQREAIKELAELIDISVIDREDGGFDINFGNGRPLVLGSVAYTIDVASAPPNGYAALSSQGTPVTGGEIAGGKLGGLLHVRDTLVPAYMSDLDAIAFEVVQQVNTLHGAGFDLNGAAAGGFFTTLAGPAGEAAAIAVDPTVAADGSLVAAASIPVAGDNQTARAIADLRDALVLGGGTATLTDGLAQFVYRIGSDSEAAQDELAHRAALVSQLRNLVDAASGVNLDEETLMMLKFQRAYEANARFFRAVDETLDTLMQAVGG